MKRVLGDDGLIIISTCCHGDSLGSSILSRLMGLSGSVVGTRWSERSFRNFVGQNGFKVIKNKKIKGVIPLIYLTASVYKEGNK